MNPDDDVLLLPYEAAAIFGVQPPQLKRWGKAGLLEGAVIRTPGNCRRYRESVLLELRASLEHEAAP